MKIYLIILIVLFIFYISNCEYESFASTTPPIELETDDSKLTSLTKNTLNSYIYGMYQTDVKALQNLANFVNQLKQDSLIIPGNINISGKVKINSPYKNSLSFNIYDSLDIQNVKHKWEIWNTSNPIAKTNTESYDLVFISSDKLGSNATNNKQTNGICGKDGICKELLRISSNNTNININSNLNVSNNSQFNVLNINGNGILNNITINNNLISTTGVCNNLQTSNINIIDIKANSLEARTVFANNTKVTKDAHIIKPVIVNSNLSVLSDTNNLTINNLDFIGFSNNNLIDTAVVNIGENTYIEDMVFTNEYPTIVCNDTIYAPKGVDVVGRNISANSVSVDEISVPSLLFNNQHNFSNYKASSISNNYINDTLKNIDIVGSIYFNQGVFSILNAQFTPIFRLDENRFIMSHPGIKPDGMYAWKMDSDLPDCDSDFRLKENIINVDLQVLLNKLNSIPLINYNFIDKYNYDENKIHGLSAQNVKKIFPEAVKLNKDYLPNIYKYADHNNIDNNIYIYVDNNLEPNYKMLKIIINDNKIYVNIIKYDNHIIIVEKWKNYNCNKVFVYGTEVNDLHKLDQKYLGMINIGGIQQLHTVMKEVKYDTNDIINIFKIQYDKLNILRRNIDKIKLKIRKST